MKQVFCMLILFLCFIPVLSGGNVNDDILPPAPEWNGESRNLVVADDDPWITPFEVSGLTRSPSYDETMAWLRKLVDSAPELEMVSIGQSLEGREIFMVIASADGRFSPGMPARKPVMLAHAGIHSGEIDGKDAGMMLLRDMTVGKRKQLLLAGVDFLFIPILSVDGHELASAYNRINQRGPEVMGWRTNSRNLNLNRDFGKLETRGVQALVGVLNDWQPDLYLDLHVTDGKDGQYDITFGFNTGDAYSPATSAWLTEHFRPRLDKELESMGHIPGPFFFTRDRLDITKGLVNFQASIRFSNGYGDARHIPTILVENHSLKPFDQRVLGTYVFMEGALKLLAESSADLGKAVASDKALRPSEVPVSWKPREMESSWAFKGIDFEVIDSEIAGGKVVRWLGKPKTFELSYLEMDVARQTVPIPKGYWVPSTWPEIIEKLEMHGIAMTRLEEAREVDVQMIRLVDPKLDQSGYEGKVRMRAELKPEDMKYRFPKGSVYVPTDQPLGKLAAVLLEPGSPDGFFQWGYFPEILQRTEYFEMYVGEPLARKMLAENPELEAEFKKKVAEDADFAGDSRARLHWFYERSHYMDPRWRLYPIGRDVN